MSSDDDRPRQTGGYADSGYYAPSQPVTPPRGDAYPGDPTAVLPGPMEADDDYGPREEVVEREPHAWHFGADLGLLVLRVTVGVLFAGHGLQKVFGMMQGPGIGGFAQYLTSLGFQHATVLSWVTGLTELAAGVLLVLGLFTPAAAAGVLGVMANAIWTKINVHQFAGAVEVEALYSAAAFALLFAGAGKISLDRNTPWFRRAPAYGFVFLLLAAGASVVTLVVLR